MTNLGMMGAPIQTIGDNTIGESTYVPRKVATFKCLTCGASFEAGAWSNRKYCGHSCYKTSISARAGRVFKGDDYKTHAQLRRAARNLVKSKRRYVTFAEVVDELGVNWEILSRLNVSVPEVNRSLGYVSKKNVFAGAVEHRLRECFDVVENEKTFEDCRSPKGAKLPFDFFVDNAFLVEADGEQHQPGGRWHEPKTAINDQVRNDYAAKTGILLVRIPYDRSKKKVLASVDALLTARGIVVQKKHDVAEPCVVRRAYVRKDGLTRKPATLGRKSGRYPVLEKQAVVAFEMRSQGKRLREVGRALGFEGNDQAVAVRAAMVVHRAKKRGLWKAASSKTEAAS